MSNQLIDFTTTIPVLIEHINYGNHVGYDLVVTLFHEAQVRLLAHFNHTELDIEGVALIVYRLEMNYKKEILYGQRLTFNFSIGEITKSCVELLSSASVENIEMCSAKTTLVFANPSTRKLVSVPNFFKNLKDQ